MSTAHLQLELNFSAFYVLNVVCFFDLLPELRYDWQRDFKRKITCHSTFSQCESSLNAVLYVELFLKSTMIISYLIML